MVGIFVQSDYKFKFYADRVNSPTSKTFSSTATMADTIEFAFLNSSGGGFPLTFPEVIDSLDITEQVNTTRELIIIGDSNLASNNVTLLPNGTGITMEGESSFVMRNNNQITKWELVDSQWVIIGNTNPTLNLGSFHMHENATPTIISTINTNTDIAGTATASLLNSNFTFDTSPNTLTYTGIKDIIVELTISASMSKANASDKIFRILGILNGSEIIGANIATNILKAMIEVSVTYPVKLVTNDVVKAMVRNETDDEDVDVTDLIVTMNEVTG